MRVKRAAILAGTSGALILSAAVAPSVANAAEPVPAYSYGYECDHSKGDKAEDEEKAKAEVKNAAAKTEDEEKARAEQEKARAAEQEKAKANWKDNGHDGNWQDNGKHGHDRK